MKVPLALCAAALLLTVTGHGSQDQGLTSGVITQQRPALSFKPLPPGQGTLSGRVIDKGTGASLADARVVVRLLGEATGQFQRASTPFGVVLTVEPGGLFTINQVPYGDYVVDVDVPGYAGDSGIFADVSRRMMHVSAGRPQATETFALSRLGTISGMVLDESGQPQADQAVMLLRPLDLGEPRLMLPDPVKALTDSGGTYQFTNVPPGEYVVGVYFRSTTMPVAVTEMYRKALQTPDAEQITSRLEDSRAPLPRPLLREHALTVDGLQVSIEDSARRLRPIVVLPDGNIAAVASTYNPGVTSLARAASISLLSGASVTGVNIRLRQQKTSRVSGVLTGPDGAASYVALRLVPEGLDRLDQAAIGEAARTITDASGRFTFLGIPPGRYTLVGHVMPFPSGDELRPGLQRVLQRWAKLEVLVTDAAVTNLRVPLLEPLSVGGRIEVVALGDVVPPAPGSIRLYLRPITGQRVTFPRTSTITNGQFSLEPAFPDDYQLVAEAPRPWRVESIVADGRDITAGTIKLVDRSVTGVVITLTSKGR